MTHALLERDLFLLAGVPVEPSDPEIWTGP